MCKIYIMMLMLMLHEWLCLLLAFAFIAFLNLLQGGALLGRSLLTQMERSINNEAHEEVLETAVPQMAT